MQHLLDLWNSVTIDHIFAAFVWVWDSVTSQEFRVFAGVLITVSLTTESYKRLLLPPKLSAQKKRWRVYFVAYALGIVVTSVTAILSFKTFSILTWLFLGGFVGPVSNLLYAVTMPIYLHLFFRYFPSLDRRKVPIREEK